jgi:hypothetical protein
MARFEIADIECASLGESPAGIDTFFELGMMYSVGRSVPTDFVTAHKSAWREAVSFLLRWMATVPQHPPWPS